MDLLDGPVREQAAQLPHHPGETSSVTGTSTRSTSSSSANDGHCSTGPPRSSRIPPTTWHSPQLRYPPLATASPLRPVITAAGAAIARRFVTACRRAGGTPSDERTLGWYANLHALRILIEFDGLRQDLTASGHASHPWTTVGPVAAYILTRTAKSKVSFVPVNFLEGRPSATVNP